MIWNRQRFIKDPHSGSVRARSNPESECIVQEVPDLRILDDVLWNAAKSRQDATKIGAAATTAREVKTTFVRMPAPEVFVSPV